MSAATLLENRGSCGTVCTLCRWLLLGGRLWEIKPRVLAVADEDIKAAVSARRDADVRRC